MKTAFEEELSEALAQRASAVPRGASERLRAIDYHPRRHLLGAPVAVGAGAAAGAATLGTVLAVVLGGAAPAYAGWSATPTSLSASSSPAPPGCISTLSSASSGPSGRSGTISGTGTWQTLLSDVRGPFTITLLQNGTSYATCFTGPSFTEVNRITSPSGSGGVQSGILRVSSQAAGAGSGSGPQGGVGALVRLEGTSSGDLNQVMENQLTTSSDGPYTFIDGRIANGVTGVTLVLDDGQDVVTTVADGWFVAWWPGNTAHATSAQVTKASGTTSEPFVPLSAMGMKAGGPQPESNGSPLPTNSTNSTNSGNTGTSGNSGPGLNTGSTGPGPTTKSNP